MYYWNTFRTSLEYTGDTTGGPWEHLHTCVIAMWQLLGPSVHPNPLRHCHHLCPILVSPAQCDVGTEGARQDGWALRDTSHLWGQGTWGNMGPYRDLVGTRRGCVETWGGGRVMVRLADDIMMAMKNCWEHRSDLGVAAGMC